MSILILGLILFGGLLNWLSQLEFEDKWKRKSTIEKRHKERFGHLLK